MVRPVGLELLAASRTPESVITCIGIAEADLGLKVPVTSENPGVAVGDTGPHEPSLETGVLQFAGISAQKIDLAVKSADVVLATMDVCTKKMRTKTVTKPVSGLRL